MTTAEPPHNKPERLAELARYNNLTTQSNTALNNILTLCNTIMQTPIAAISFIGETTQWIQASRGLDISQVDRDLTFCTYTIMNPTEPLIIEDAAQDARFKDHPAVQGAAPIRFYIGFPLTTAAGHALGTLCVADTAQRSPSTEELQSLQVLTDNVMTILELNRVQTELTIEKERLKLAEASVQLGHWDFNVQTQEIFWSDQIYTIHGVTKGEYEPVLDSALDFYHPEDRDRVSNILERSIEKKQDLSFEARLVKPSGEVVYVHSTATPRVDTKGELITLFGTFQDITERKLTELSKQHLMQELVASNRFNEAVVASSKHMIITCNPEGVINSFNQAAEHQLGFRAADLIGKKNTCHLA